MILFGSVINAESKNMCVMSVCSDLTGSWLWEKVRFWAKMSLIQYLCDFRWHLRGKDRLFLYLCTFSWLLSRKDKVVPSPSSSPSCGRRCVSDGVLLSAGRTRAPRLRSSPSRPSRDPPDAPPPAALSPRWSSPRGTCDMSSSPRRQQPIITQMDPKKKSDCSGQMFFTPQGYQVCSNLMFSVWTGSF